MSALEFRGKMVAASQLSERRYGAASSVVVDASRRRERTTANRAATKTKREQDRCSLCLARIIVTGLDISAWIQQLQ
jgi:hypothetical protein